MDFRMDRNLYPLIEVEMRCMETSSLLMFPFISASHSPKEIIGYP